MLSIAIDILTSLKGQKCKIVQQLQQEAVKYDNLSEKSIDSEGEIFEFLSQKKLKSAEFVEHLNIEPPIDH